MLTIEIPKTALDSTELQALGEMLDEGSPRLMGKHGEGMVLPESMCGLLKEAVRSLCMGLSVSVVAEEEQMSTQMAAQLLGCSRPHVVKLLEAGEIPFEMVGTHRRIRRGSLLGYRKKRDEERHEGLNQMSRDAVAWGVYHGIPLEDGQSDE